MTLPARTADTMNDAIAMTSSSGPAAALTYLEADRVAIALGFVLAGELDDFPKDMGDLCKSAQAKINAVPRGGCMVPLSRHDVAMLWHALTNGAEGVLQPFSGFSAAQKATFRRAANRIADAGGIAGARF